MNNKFDKFGWKCPKCENFNITIDLNSGTYQCTNCNSIEKPKKINLEDLKNQLIEKEENNLNKIKTLGTNIQIEPNDFSSLGL